MCLQTITFLLIFSKLGYSATTSFPSSYQFGYTVSDKHSGDYKSHHEESDGKEVRGRYSLVEPTGDLRVVTYKADRANGFRAVVNVQPTPTYRLVELPSLQKLRRQHDTAVNNTDSVQTMAVVEDESSDKNMSQGSGGVFDVDHSESSGPHMIAVKVQQESESVSSAQEPLLKLEVTSDKPESTNEGVVSPEKTKDKSKPDSTVEFQVTIKDIDDGSRLINSLNETDPQHVVKSMVELNPNSSVSTQHNENVSTSDHSKTSQNQPLEIQKPDVQGSNKPASTDTEEKLKPNIGMSETGNYENVKMEDIKENNMMLAALLLPTTPILKFTCTPDRPDKNNMPMVPTTPNMAAQRNPHLGPSSSMFTPGFPLFPFQLVNFSPIKQIFSQNKFPPQNSNPFLSTTSPLISTVFPSKQPLTTAAQQNPETVHKDEDVPAKRKPPSGYTNVRTIHAHHFLPPPWAPHPQHNYRHMPIFVLPMSHNSNLAPMFNPALLDHHNQ
ncbi:uncharacterized protein LOC128993902 [Macrosteles quadrilineatus]|uniref:uncharacterized protein LOC128993902 n=1 Tax=Macrosteles quadrilineatus TaxID=74068 RepID=UPI0023E13623|nr:uncharacterized protein LOC128993902 [Macrosteles quadrilineatus]